MCCRYWTDKSPELRAIVEEMNRSPLMDRWDAVTTYGEIRPADVAPVVASNRAGARSVFPMKWGFTGRTLLMNARSETAAEKPTFKEAWASHRCAVPASWYFEWEHLVDDKGRKRAGDRYKLRPATGGLTWLCGLYRIENGLPVFVVLTRAPGDGIRFIHDRMPLILPEAHVGEWIRPGADPNALARAAVTDIAYEKG